MLPGFIVNSWHKQSISYQAPAKKNGNFPTYKIHESCYFYKAFGYITDNPAEGKADEIPKYSHLN